MAKKEIKGFNVKCFNYTGGGFIAYDAVGYYNGQKYLSINLHQRTILNSISSKMKILNATLELTAEEWNIGPSFEGINVYIGDELIDIIASPGKNGKVFIDITNELVNLMFSNLNQSILKIEPRNTLSKGYIKFYSENSDELYEPKIVIDYIPKHQIVEQEAFQQFDCLDAGIGNVNLRSGELCFEHTDIDSGSVFLPIILKHIYNSNRYNEKGDVIVDVKNISNFNMGDGWKLNLQQYLFKNENASLESGYDVYNYLDGNGNIHEFSEFYYYILNDTRHYILKEQVVINLNGTLSYDGFEVVRELKSTSGLTLITDYTKYKNDNLIELRTEEISTLEDQIEELNNYVSNLEYNNVLLNKNKELVEKYIEIKNVQYEIDKIVQSVSSEELTLNEKILEKQKSLKNLKEEFNEKFAEYCNADSTEYSKYYIAKEKYLEDISKLFYDLDNAYIEMINKRDTVYEKMVSLNESKNESEDENQTSPEAENDNEEEYFQAQKDYSNASNLYQDARWDVELAQREFSDVEQEATIIYQKKSEKVNDEIEDESFESNKIINELISQKNSKSIALFDLSKKYNSESDELQLNQINYEIEKNNNEIKKYKNQINKLNNSLIKLYESSEVNHIINSSNIIFGFNKYGYLISLSDSNLNKIVFEYENGKIIKLIENDDKQLVLTYENNVLTEIINFLGQKVKFKYNNNKLTKIVNEDETETTFKYDENGLLFDIQNTFGFGYKIDYNSNRVVKLSEYTITKIVKNSKIEYLDNELYGLISDINYIDLYTTIITNEKGNTKTYLMDNYGNLKSICDSVDGKAISINNEFVSKKCQISTLSKSGVENLISDVNWIGSERSYSEGYGLLGGAPFSENYAYANVDIEKVRNKKNLILSAYVTASSAYVKPSRINNYIYDDINDEHIIYSSENKQKRKFELRVETSYSNGRVDITKCSFDWMNKQKQYISFPVSFEECKHEVETQMPCVLPATVHSEEVITNIKIIFDYSYNINYLIFEDVKLEECEWNYFELNDNNRKVYETSNTMTGEKFYKYNRNNLLIEENYVENGKEEHVVYKYDSNNKLIRNENNYGDVSEILYKNNKVVGNVTYNLSNPTKKFYNEYETYENGLNKCEFDKRGFAYNQYEYLNENSKLVSSIKLSNDSKIYKGYNYKNNQLLAVSQESNGVCNSNELCYTKGLLTKLISNDTSYEYEYDGFGRIIKFKINDKLFFSKEYNDEEMFVSTLFISGDGYKISYDIYGNIVSKKYIDKNGLEYNYLNNEFDAQHRLIKLLEYENELCYNETTLKYDEFGNIINELINENNETISINNLYNIDNTLLETSIIYDDYTQNYKYNYEDNLKKRLKNIQLPNGVVQSVEYDKLDRITRIKLNNNVTKEFYYLQCGDHSTSLISMLLIKKDNNIFSKQVYVYDVMGNISEIRENGIILLKYYYDEVNRLIREDNRNLNFTKLFEYDCNGNLLSSIQYEFTTDEIESEPIKIYENLYDNQWKDQIIKHNEDLFAYDDFGNLITYKDTTLEFTKGKLLTKYGDVEYKYNSQGLRISKLVDGELVKFTLSGNKIIKQHNTNSNECIYYHYGVDGLVGFNYNGIEYLYIKNLQNDITHITDINGNIVVKYIYDAWGNHKVYNSLNNEVVDENFIGNINPFRYRSYYYDEETNLFLVSSRYYSPELCRWISPDDIEYLDPESVNGLNLYCYCLNNPIMYVDPTGHFAMTAFGIWAIIGIVSAAVAIGGGAQLASNALAGETGSDLWRGVAGAAIGSGVNALALCLSPFTGGASLAFAAGLGAIAQTGVDTIETLIRGEDVSLLGTALDLGLNFATTFAGNWIGSKLVPTNAGWFKTQKFLSVFTKPYGQKILLQTVIGAGLSAGVNFVRKFDWSSVDWKKFIPVIPVPVVPTYPYF